MVWPSPFSQESQSFWFHLLCLDSKGAKNKLGARSKKCIFLGYEENSKAYRLYDEVNKKFVISRDVIFLETNKNDQSIERQIDRLENYPHPKKYSESEYEIQNLEGGIPILDQPLEFPYEAPTPPHEEVLATSPKQEIQLDDVIERLGRLKLEGNEAPATNQPGPSWKIPKWAIKTLESVHPDEVGKTGTRNSKRHGGEADIFR